MSFKLSPVTVKRRVVSVSRWNFRASEDGCYFRENGFIPPEDSYISEGAWKEVVPKKPLVCVEFVPISPDRKVLLGWRKEEPAKGTLYTIGGGIIAGETFEEAASRVAKRELGIDVYPNRIECAGYVSQVWATSPIGKHGCHGITWVMYCNITQQEMDDIKIVDNSHSKLEWVDPFVVLEDVDDKKYHPILKKYLRDIFKLR